MKKRIIAVLSLVLCLALCLFACDKSGDAEIELVKWKAPSYDDTYYVGEEIRLKKLTVEDENGNEYEAVITVKFGGETLVKKKTSGSFTPEIAGDYDIHYVVLDENEEEIARKTITITVIVKNNNNNNGGNGGNSGGNGGSSTTLSIASQFGTMKDWTDGSFFTISGNKITFKKSTNVGDYKGVKFESINYTPADKEEQMTFTIKNSTSGTVTAKIKSVSDAGEAYSADLTVNAGSTKSMDTHVLGYSNKDSATRLNEMEIYFGNTEGKGTIEIGLTLGSSSGGNGGSSSSTLSALKVADGSTDSLSVSGNTVTFKNAISETQYKSVIYDVSGWNKTTQKYIKIVVKNNASSAITVKYKAMVDGAAQYGDYDLEIPAGQTKTYVGTAQTYGFGSGTANSITKIELFFITSGSGTATITTTFSATEQQGDKPAESEMDAHTKSVLGQLQNTYDETDYFTISVDTVTVKRTVTMNQYKSVSWKNITTYSSSADKSLELTVTNNTTGTVTLKYKIYHPAYPGDNERAIYFDFESIAAGATAILKTNIGGQENVLVSSLSQIDLFIASTGTGALKIVPKLSSEVIKYGNDINIENPTGATITAKVDGKAVTSAREGDVVTLSYVLSNSEAYNFGNFTLNGTEIDGNTFTMSDEAVTVSATVNKVKNIITITQTNAGTITAKVNGASVTAAAVGEEITFAVDNVKTGYTLTGFKVNGTAIDGNTFVMANEDITVSATFTQTAYYVIINQPSNGGSITVTANGNAVGNVPFDNGTEITLSNTPNANYKFVKYVVNGADYNDGTVTINGRDLTISAVFEQNVFTITKTNPTGATINAPATAEKGETVTLGYTLSDNYTFDGWTVKDASGNTITVTNNQFTMPSSDVTVTAKVKLLSATATVTKVGKYDEISYTNTTSSVTITGTSGSNDLYHSAEISLSNTEGQNKITFTVTNDSASSVTVYVWVATETNNRHSNGISIQSVTGATKGNGSGHDIAQQTVVAGGSTQITITLSSAMTSGSALRVTPYMGGTLTVSDFIIGG